MARPGNEIPKLTKRRSNSVKPANPQTAKPVKPAAPEIVPSEKIKLTVYLEPELLTRLRRAEFELKSANADSARRFSRTAIVSLALERLLEEYDAEGGIASEVAALLANQ